MTFQFLNQEFDYLFFVYGLAFMILAGVCATIRNEPPVRLPWIWLGLFGFTHGVNEWLDMIALSLGDERSLSVVRFGVMTLSFIFLVEFGRDGTRRVVGKGPGKWIYIPLFACVGIGSQAGISGANVAARDALGLVGGVWSSFVLFLASRIRLEEGRRLRFAAVAMMAYAMATVNIVPPYSLTDKISSLSFSEIPVQVIRGGLAVIIAAMIWGYYLRSRRSGSTDFVGMYGKKDALQIVGMLVATLGLGWILTQHVGTYVDRDERKDIMDQTKIAAAVLNPDKILYVTRTHVDTTDQEYRALRERLSRVRTSNPEVIRSYVLYLREGKVTSVIDGLQTGGLGYAEAGPGRPLLLNVLPDMLATGCDTTAGPWFDREELCLSGFAALRDPRSGHTFAIFGLDVNAADWRQTVGRARMASIMATLMISMILIGFTIARHRLLELAHQIAASERRLVQAQKVAHIGSWTYDVRANQFTWSEEMFRVFGVPGRAVPSYAEQLNLLHPDDRSKLDRIFQAAVRDGRGNKVEYRVILPDGTMRYIVARAEVKREPDDEIIQLFGTAQDITERKHAEEERERMLHELEAALAKVKVLSGLLPICAWCKRIRDDEGYWKQIESYIEAHSDAAFTHGICPDCAESRRKHTRNPKGVVSPK